MAGIPMPLDDPLVNTRRPNLRQDQKDENEGKVTEVWIPYLQSQNDLASTAIRQTTTPVSLTAQSASIGVTAIPTSTLSSGLYRFTYYARITTAAGTSSSLTVVASWTDGGIACSKTFTAITGNTTSTVQSETFMPNIDASSPISYSTTYASVGAPAMQYSLSIVLEGMQG